MDRVPIVPFQLSASRLQRGLQHRGNCQLQISGPNILEPNGIYKSLTRQSVESCPYHVSTRDVMQDRENEDEWVYK